MARRRGRGAAASGDGRDLIRKGPAWMDPLLLDVPDRLETERLVLRCPRAGDGPAVNVAVCDSLEGLRPWMPWAKAAPSIDDSEAYCRRMHAKFLLREDLVLLIFERGSEGAAG